MSPFLVETRLVSLAVITAGGALKTIRLGALAPRPPDTAFERRVAGELAAYFEGARTRFSVPLAPEGTAFQLGVWHALQQIPTARREPTERSRPPSATAGRRGPSAWPTITTRFP